MGCDAWGCTAAPAWGMNGGHDGSGNQGNTGSRGSAAEQTTRAEFPDRSEHGALDRLATRSRREDDAVVEVGPGTGLAERASGGQSPAIDPDRVRRAGWPPRWRSAFAASRRWRCIMRMARSSMAGRLFKHRPLKFLGNLPYSMRRGDFEKPAQPPASVRAGGGDVAKGSDRPARGHPRHQGLRHPVAADAGRIGRWIRSARCRPRRFTRGRGSIPCVAILRPRTSGLPAFDHRLVR